MLNKFRKTKMKMKLNLRFINAMPGGLGRNFAFSKLIQPFGGGNVYDSGSRKMLLRDSKFQNLSERCIKSWSITINPILRKLCTILN